MKEWIEKITDYFKADHRTFAQGVCFYKLVWVFTIGSIFGVYYEQILNLMKSLLADGNIFWESRRGVIDGPLSPVYGAGAALIVYLLARRKRPGWQTWLYGALLGGAFEYTISFLQEWAIGTTSWDYGQQFLNINGRTTDYNKKTIFYDEQPTQYHTTVQQRIRWIRGYFDARKKYIPLIRRDLRKNKENENAKRSACVGVKPYIMIIIGMILWALADVIAGISRANIAVMFLQVGMLLLAEYIAMMIVTIVMLRREKDQLHLSVKMKRHMIWFYPLYLVTYIPCALKAMLKKNVTWVRIDHTETNL